MHSVVAWRAPGDWQAGRGVHSSRYLALSTLTPGVLVRRCTQQQDVSLTEHVQLISNCQWRPKEAFLKNRSAKPDKGMLLAHLLTVCIDRKKRDF